MSDSHSLSEIKVELGVGVAQVMTRYPSNRSAIMPALDLAQQKYGKVDGLIYQAVAELLDVPEIWVFDLGEKKRVARFEVPNLAAAFLGDMMGIEDDSFVESVLHWVVPSEGAHTIVVSEDDDPVLFVRNARAGAVVVLDANTGETRRFLSETGLAGPTLRVP